MTDKKYEELLKCAKGLIGYMDDCDNGTATTYVRCSDEYQALKACLPPPPPSREQIAAYFEEHVNWLAGHQEHKPKGDIKQYCNYAIEEFRK